ncbi:MAG: MFS transporter [Alphaproteobacteria bacterium]
MVSLFLQRSSLLFLYLGLLSGIPFLLTLSTLSFWLIESGISKATIGSFMLTSIPYSLKPFLSPLLDFFKAPFIGKKTKHYQGWGIILQLSLAVLGFALSFLSPQHHFWIIVLCAFVISFLAALQDIIIDAIRLHFLEKTKAGVNAAMEAAGFRIGMFISGGGALYLASFKNWSFSFTIMALCHIFGLFIFLFCPEAKMKRNVPKTRSFVDALIHQRKLFNIVKGQLFYLLSFILFFKAADTILNSMCLPFLYELGFSKLECANISKTFGISMMVVGGLTGGWVISKFEKHVHFAICVFFQVLSCCLFILQAQIGYNITFLTFTMGIENFCSGFYSTIFIAHLSYFCASSPSRINLFTLLYSIGSFFRVFFSTIAGWLAACISWSALFFIASLLSILFFCCMNLSQVRFVYFRKCYEAISKRTIFPPQ